jgi:hypothetical protein
MWSTENWVQDDTKLSGYPSPVGTAYPEAFSLDGFVSLWKKSASGYFIPSEDISPFSIDGFATIWLFNHQFNGYPHPAEFPVESKYPAFTGFSVNGIGADFKQISQSRAVILPEKINFRFDIKETLTL